MKDEEELWGFFNAGQKKEVIVQLLMDIRNLLNTQDTDSKNKEDDKDVI